MSIPASIVRMQKTAAWDDVELLRHIFEFHRKTRSTARIVAYLEAQAELAEQGATDADDTKPAGLTTSQKRAEATRLMAHGLTVTEIAREMMLSRQTIYTLLAT